MANEDFVIDIYLDRIGKGIKDVERFGRLVDKAVDDGIEEIGKKLEAKITEKLISYGLGDSRLLNTIVITPTDTGIYISVGKGHEYATFVEYGTGIVGKGNPHPKAAGWVYDVNAHGVKGWWYPTTNDDPNPYTRVGSDGILRAWTKGMPSRPFMYETYLYGRRIALRTINNHIRRIKV